MVGTARKSLSFTVLVISLASALLAGCGYETEITGSVLDEGQRPVVGVQGRVCCQDRCSELSTPTDSSGHFTAKFVATEQDFECHLQFRPVGHTNVSPGEILSVKHVRRYKEFSGDYDVSLVQAEFHVPAPNAVEGASPESNELSAKPDLRAPLRGMASTPDKN